MTARALTDDRALARQILEARAANTAPDLALRAAAPGRADPPDAPSHAPRYLTLREALARPELFEPPAAVLEPLAYAGRVTLLSAREKMGKSTLMGQAVAALSRGAPLFAGLPAPPPTPVLWYGIDEPLGDAVRRLGEYGADVDAVTLSDAIPTAAEMEDRIIAIGAGLVVIDTLANLWAGRLENDRDANAMTLFLRPYVEVARRTGAALVLLYHTNKAGREYRGSVALGASVDAPLTLGSPKVVAAGESAATADEGDGMEEDDGRRVIVGRTRWGKVTLRLAFDGRRYTLGDAPAPLRLRVLWALRDGVATSAKGLASALHVRPERMFDLIGGLTAEGLVTREGGPRGALGLTPRGRVEADGPTNDAAGPGGGSRPPAAPPAGTAPGTGIERGLVREELDRNPAGTSQELVGNRGPGTADRDGSQVVTPLHAHGNRGGGCPATEELI